MATLARAAGAQSLGVPAVPYLPQTDALCGGASLAMVLRYWGATDVRPEDFAGSLTPAGTGIPTEELRRLTEARGFQAFAFNAGRAEAVTHLEKGRPLIALLSTAPQGHHYVVVLAWSNQRVLVHDPAVGPYRIIPEAEWLRRWEAAGGWALLVLPPDGVREAASASPKPAAHEQDACTALVQPAVDLALAGSPDAARERLVAASAWCPASSAPVREMAALEFRRQNWSAAAELAAAAVRRDPLDRFGWKLLATSRFLAGQRQEALGAWNRLDEPRLDLVLIDGFERTPTRLVHEYLAERPNTLLTAKRLRRVQRRIEALPAAQLARISYRPLSGGAAQLDVTVVERRAFSSPRTLLLQAVLRAATEGAIGVDASALAPSGEAVRLFGQWQPNRARGGLSVSAARFLGTPGVVTAEALWDEQSYRLRPTSVESRPVRERRERAALALSHWWAADTRAGFGVAADHWSGRGRFLSLSGEVDQRLGGDKVALRAGGASWWSGQSAPFHAAHVRGSARTRVGPERARARLDASYDFASTRAPLALWSGAGTGPARALLLRAHPLLRGGVIEGAAFGRQLLSGSGQVEAPIGSLGPARLRLAVFVDAVKVLAPTRAWSAVDLGVGLRVQPPGWKAALRVDLATPWGSARPQLSAGWLAEWP